MSILTDLEITELCQNNDNPMITPFVDHSVSSMGAGIKIPSYGLSSMGYDIRLGRNFKVYKTLTGVTTGQKVLSSVSTEHWPSYGCGVLDILSSTEHEFTNIDDVDYILMEPNSFALGVSHERVSLPPDIHAHCGGKSTLARFGLSLIPTPIEPGWSGYITLEIANLSPRVLKVPAGIGISQLTFTRAKLRCGVSYSDRGGKYQNQPPTPVVAKL